MQYLKDDIKNRILSAALAEFDQKGFHQASMVNISLNAGISIGNVYRYFKNKKQLFNELARPVYDVIRDTVCSSYDELKKESTYSVITDLNMIMDMYEKYGAVFMILMCKSKGSDYEHVKEDLIQWVYEGHKKEFQPIINKKGIELPDSFIYLISSSLIESIIMIFKQCNTNQEIRTQMDRLLLFYYKDILERF